MQLPLQCYPNPSFAIASGTGLLPQPYGTSPLPCILDSVGWMQRANAGDVFQLELRHEGVDHCELLLVEQYAARQP